MTPAQHDQLRHAAIATAAQALTRFAATLLRDALPHEEPGRSQCVKLFELKLSLARDDYLLMTFPWLSPAESDLWAGLAQEEFDRLAADFLAGVGQ